MNILIELIATILYIFVIMPLYAVLSVLFMGMCVLLLTIRIPVVNRKLSGLLNQRKVNKKMKRF